MLIDPELTRGSHSAQLHKEVGRSPPFAMCSYRFPELIIILIIMITGVKVIASLSCPEMIREEETFCTRFRSLRISSLLFLRIAWGNRGSGQNEVHVDATRKI